MRAFWLAVCLQHDLAPNALGTCETPATPHDFFSDFAMISAVHPKVPKAVPDTIRIRKEHGQRGRKALSPCQGLRSLRSS
jgi:hypothetical protein